MSELEDRRLAAKLDEAVREADAKLRHMARRGWSCELSYHEDKAGRPVEWDTAPRVWSIFIRKAPPDRLLIVGRGRNQSYPAAVTQAVDDAAAQESADSPQSEGT